MTSVSTYSFTQGTGIYSASKAALTAYSKTVAVELAGRKIKVNTVKRGQEAGVLLPSIRLYH
ncbi:SDR family oxidoreductase [Eisenibacter elegans]|uniref:SDR family oxidoreductase n=1 Tax=Eisenibacter elegans TaxID=997 RepID=UPI00040CFCEB|nr:SDR family oxidoreductase [Eisenibacter elegans]